MRSGCCSATSCASNAPPTTPLSDDPWSTAYTLLAPYSPSWGATSSASAPEYTASTVSPISRAFVSSSSVAEVGLPSAASAYTHTFGSVMCSGLLDDLQLFEEGDDPLVGVTFVLDLLARLPLGCSFDRFDLLPGALPADLILRQAKVAHFRLVDRLVLGRHDPLERGIARLDHAGGHADNGGGGGAPHVLSRLRLGLGVSPSPPGPP